MRARRRSVNHIEKNDSGWIKERSMQAAAQPVPARKAPDPALVRSGWVNPDASTGPMFRPASARISSALRGGRLLSA